MDEHLCIVRDKVNRVAGALLGFMTNIGGPRSSRHRLYASVVDSILLYGAPAWSEAAKTHDYVCRAASIHRRACLRVICGFCTISNKASYVVASIPPLELLIDERSRKKISPLLPLVQKIVMGQNNTFLQNRAHNLSAIRTHSNGVVIQFRKTTWKGLDCNNLQMRCSERREKRLKRSPRRSLLRIILRKMITRMVKQTAREGVSAICRSPYRCEPCVRVSKRAAVDEATARGNSHESLSPFYTSVSLPHCIADLAAEQSSQIKFFCILICATEF
ncbi:unnamed protein product [Trichogramma brassicae]|uniref:Reverse transcriptase n=1 Tax=Trichogramma brassicae TaxID=86971 RepID=A0A6H5IE11_9HYME|nr:unnamed protein product [Trichogramma brassicae]